MASTPTSDRMDVIIIGAGIVGLSLAWHLRRLGVDRVMLLEAREPGQQSTGVASGGIRRQFGNRIEIEMTLTSWRFYQAVLSDYSFPGVFEPVGYAFLAGPEHIPRLKRAWNLQRAMGLSVRWLDFADLAEMVPFCDTRGLAGGTFCAEDGFIDPSDVAQWLLRECRCQGVVVRKHTPVDAIEISGGRVRAVHSGSMRIASDVVVNAAGAWAGAVGTLASVSIPIEPSPRVKFVTQAGLGLPSCTPLVVDLPSGTYVRSERGRTVFGVKPEKKVVSFDIDVDQDLLSWMAERACARFPGLRDAKVRGLIRGLYELTPDGLPLAGPVADLAGFYVAAGFNGHGIMHGPGVTQALAELVVTGHFESLDLKALCPDRFERTAPAERNNFDIFL